MDRIKWRDAVASENGPQSPTTRLVLLVLSLHMDPRGHAFPSTRLLSDRSGLSRRVVCEHLERAEADGWIARKMKGGGQGWRRWTYTARTPDVVTDSHHEAGYGESPRIEDERGYSGAERGYSDDKNVVTEGNSNPLVNPSKNPSSTARSVNRKRGEERKLSAKRKGKQPSPHHEAARQLVAHLDGVLKSHGVPAGIGTSWAPSIRMATTALNEGRATSDDYAAAITWAFGADNDYHRRQLIACGMKWLRGCWAAWLEAQNEAANRDKLNALIDGTSQRLAAGSKPRYHLNATEIRNQYPSHDDVVEMVQRDTERMELERREREAQERVRQWIADNPEDAARIKAEVDAELPHESLESELPGMRGTRIGAEMRKRVRQRLEAA